MHAGNLGLVGARRGFLQAQGVVQFFVRRVAQFAMQRQTGFGRAIGFHQIDGHPDLAARQPLGGDRRPPAQSHLFGAARQGLIIFDPLQIGFLLILAAEGLDGGDNEPDIDRDDDPEEAQQPVKHGAAGEGVGHGWPPEMKTAFAWCVS